MFTGQALRGFLFMTDKMNSLIRYAEKMKNKPTMQEQFFEKMLNKKQVRFISQQILYPYIVDFLIKQKKLIVEIDGDFHNNDINQLSYDTKRDNYLMSFGFQLWRFSNSDILKNYNKIIDDIRHYQPQKTKGKFTSVLKKLSNPNYSQLNKMDFEIEFRTQLRKNIHYILTWKYFNGHKPNFV